MDKQGFEKLKDNLINHHINCIGNDGTYAPIYLARVEETVWGFQEDYAQEHTLGYCDWEGCGYNTVQEFVDSYDEEDWGYVFGLSDYPNKEFFLEDHTSLEDVASTMRYLQPNNGWEVYHGNKQWKTVNWFLTRGAAENFVIGKGGNPDENVWVDSLYRSSEFRGLLEAIAKGDLVWKGDE